MNLAAAIAFATAIAMPALLAPISQSSRAVAAPAQRFDACVHRAAPAFTTSQNADPATIAGIDDSIALACLRSAGLDVAPTDPRVPPLGACLRQAVIGEQARVTPLGCLASSGLLGPSPSPVASTAASPSRTIVASPTPSPIVPSTAPSIVPSTAPSVAPSTAPSVAPSREPLPSPAPSPAPSPTRRLAPSPSPRASVRPKPDPTHVLPSPPPQAMDGVLAPTAYLTAGVSFAAGTLFGVSFAVRAIARRERARKRRSASVEIDLQQKG